MAASRRRIAETRIASPAMASQTSSEPAPQIVSDSFMLRVFYVFLALALVALLVSLAGKWAGHSIALAGHTDSRTTHEVVIGNNVLAVPANMIRFGSARRNGVADRLDLYVRWPDLAGYHAAARADFNHVDGRRNIVFLSFEQRIMSRDMSGRLKPIYEKLVDPVARDGPAGLELYDFDADSGYVDEVLVVGERDGARPFVARCLSGEAARHSLAPCERDLHLGDDLSLTYRFSPEVALDWRELDPAMRSLAAELLRTED